MAIGLCLTGVVYFLEKACNGLKTLEYFLSNHQKSYKTFKESHRNLALDQVDKVVGCTTL